jgi:hypothetical protein
LIDEAGSLLQLIRLSCSGHNLHRLNYLHFGATKRELAFENAMRIYAYGGKVNPLGEAAASLQNSPQFPPFYTTNF